MSSLLRYYAELETMKMEEVWGLNYTDEERLAMIETIIMFESGQITEEDLDIPPQAQPNPVSI